MTKTLDDDDLDAGDRKLLADIESHGFHIVTIPADESGPGWAFSIGLHHVSGHPEVVVFGLPDEVNAAVISGIGERVREGEVFSDLQASGGILEGYDCMFREVRPEWFHPFLGYARWFYEGDGFPVLQCIWPDKDRRCPWDEGFRSDWIDSQPLLFHAGPDESRTAHWLATMGDDGGDGET